MRTLLQSKSPGRAPGRRTGMLLSLLVALALLAPFSSFSQINQALSAVASHSGGGTGVYDASNYNDNVIAAAGSTPWGWVSTSGNPSTSSWIEFDWSSAKPFTEITFYTVDVTTRYLQAADIQIWNGSAWVTIKSFSNSTPYPLVYTIKLGKTYSSNKLRIANLVTAGTQTSNPNNREIQVWYKPSAPYDAGIASLVSPVNFCAPSTQDVTVRIYNYGTKQLTSVTLNWMLDGVLQTPTTYTGTLDTVNGSGSTYADIKLTSLSFTASTVKNLKAWTSQPNNVKDTINLNDTLTATLRSSLSGTFTINKTGSGSTNFTTFAAAIATLKANGICGPVTVQVNPDQYNESFAMGPIQGASATNTITFVGMGSTPGATRVWSSTAAKLVDLTGATYTTFQNMKFEYTGSTSGIYCLYVSTANGVTIKKCTIQMPVNSNTNYPLYSNLNNNCTYDGNTIRGGYYAGYEYGSSAYTSSQNNVWSNNRITQFYYYGIYSYYGYQNKFIGNYIDSAGTTSGYGMYNYYGGGLTVERNIIPAYNLYYPMMLYYMNYYSNTTQYLVDNNLLGNLVNTSMYYGMLLYPYNLGAGAKVKISHNTVVNPSYYGIYLYTYNTTGVEFTNNLIYTGRSVTYMLYDYYVSNLDKFDGNVWYSTLGSNLTYYYNGTTYSNFAAWQAAAASFGQATHDQFTKVIFKSNSDPHLDQTVPAPTARSVGILTDVDGDVRCPYYPTPGADENFYQGAKPKAAQFSGPSTVVDGAVVTYFNNASPTDPNFYSWYINGVKVSDSIHLETTALKLPTTTYTVKLVTLNCYGKDSFQKTVNVVAPSSAPVSDFVANKNIIKSGDIVSFTDISSNGPSSWQWSISPDSSFNGSVKTQAWKLYYGSLTGYKLQVKFLNPGKYKVCLTASNSKGKGNTECKVNYIEVLGSYNIGSYATLSDASGWLYDNGGPSGNYDYANTYKTLIAPCASKVYMVVTQFAMYCNYDYLTMYDTTVIDKNKVITPSNKVNPCNKTNAGTNGVVGFTGGTGYVCANQCIPSVTDTMIAKSGKMLVVQAGGNGGNFMGFEAFWWSTPKVGQAKPKAGFTTKDSLCTNGMASFTNTTTGQDVTYLWDLDGDISTFEANTAKAPNWAYFFPGKYKITLIATNCGGVDTFTKTIVVYDPASPKVSFTADNTNPTINDVVYFTPTTKQCVDAYTWKFKPASGIGTAAFMNGTTKSSANPQIMFSDTGCWTVTLISSNVSGVDSLSASCFIHVKGAYCVPSVSNLISDIGISRVVFNTIINVSQQAATGYSNFTPSISTTVETGVTYKLTVERTTNKNKITRNVWIDWNADGDFADAGEMVAQETNASTLSWTTNITIPTTAKVGATVMRIAVNQGSLSNAVCGVNTYGEYEDYRLYIRPDVTAPVITLVGADTIRLEKGHGFHEPGYSATDNLDGNITSKVIVSSTPAFDSLIEAKYIITYNVKDAAGNAAITKRRVVIVTPDVTAPELVVEKPDTLTVEVFRTFNVPKVLRAFDLVDNDLSGSVLINNAVNLNVLGTYKITYSVSDASGNFATAVRVVKVVDTIKPTMKLIGGSPVKWEVNTPYVDSGVSVSDNYYSDAELRKQLLMTSNVDVTKLGTYTVVYVLKDPSGNGPVSVSRTVIIVDTQKPVLSMNGDTLIVLEVNTKLNDPGIGISDNYDKITKWDTLGTFYQNFPNGVANKLGNFKIVYSVTDKSGNTSFISRSIKVVDDIAPVIMLKGEPAVGICRWKQYTDSGYTLTDNYWKAANITVTKEGSYMTNGTQLPGLYYLRYKAVDGSGNISYSDWRQITVLQCLNNGIADQNAADNSVNIFPNPSTGLFNVSVNGTMTANITVSNMMGQTIGAVINQGVGNNYTLDLRGQSAGVYLLNITTGDKTVTKRIVVEK